jgi:hypothetical protein
MISASARSDERLPQVPERTVLIQQAFRLEWLTVAWMVIEAVVAIGSGVIAGSLTLTAFGLDSVIELVSASVLIWRLTEELRRGEEFSRHAERIASRSGGALLFLLVPSLQRVRTQGAHDWQVSHSVTPIVQAAESVFIITVAFDGHADVNSTDV